VLKTQIYVTRPQCVKNDLLPQIYAGYLLHVMVALAAFVKGSGRYEGIVTTTIMIYEVRKFVHYHTIQINQITRCNNFISLLFDVYVWLNMFRAPLCPSSRAFNRTNNLWFYRWRVAVAALLVMVCQTTTNNAATTILQR